MLAQMISISRYESQCMQIFIMMTMMKIMIMIIVMMIHLIRKVRMSLIKRSNIIFMIKILICTASKIYHAAVIRILITSMCKIMSITVMTICSMISITHSTMIMPEKTKVFVRSKCYNDYLHIASKVRIMEFISTIDMQIRRSNMQVTISIISTT